MEIESDVQRKVKEMKKIIIKEALINFFKKRKMHVIMNHFKLEGAATNGLQMQQWKDKDNELTN